VECAIHRADGDVRHFGDQMDSAPFFAHLEVCVDRTLHGGSAIERCDQAL
jgi:hypothetical protein